MGQGGELVPYDTTHIRAASEADAIRLSKQWAQDAAMSEDSYLQVLQEDKGVASSTAGRVLRPGGLDDLIGRDPTARHVSTPGPSNPLGSVFER